MTAETVMTMTYQAMKVALAMAGPLLVITLIVGLVISIFQAATQINEMTLSFIPKLLAMCGVLVLLGPWLIGIAMGFSMRLVFAAAQTAGEFVGLQMGLSFASFFDPSTGANTAVLSRLFNIVAMLTFLALDGHLLVLAALVRSFDTLPVAAIQLHQNGWGVVVEWGKTVFVSGLLLALPLICALLTINLAMGILNRAAPQLSVFSVGFPVSLIVGVVLLTVVLPNSGPFLEALFESGLSTMSRVADALAGR